MGGLVSNPYDRLTKKDGNIVLNKIPGCQQSTYKGKKRMKQTICPDCTMKILNGN